MKQNNLRNFCVAPMMGYTTPHARKLYRILSKNAFLFTEMIPTKTMIHSKTKDLIIENNNDNPVALQVGGSELQDLKICAAIAKSYHYDEINLNVGCPSKAVQKGNFGACLMLDKVLVRNCIETMQEISNIEISMKCRIGIGHDLNYDFFSNFIDEISKTGIKYIYIHARNAIMKGLSPKNNRNIPPLNYEFVSKIKIEHPNINFILNGGINTIKDGYTLLKKYDGIMAGRLIQNNPFSLLLVDKLFYNKSDNITSTENIIIEYFKYIRNKISYDSNFRLLSPLLGILFALPNSKNFKIKIQKIIQNNEIDTLEKLFMQFFDECKNNEKLVSNLI